jgi:hypothetical protein
MDYSRDFLDEQVEVENFLHLTWVYCFSCHGGDTQICCLHEVRDCVWRTKEGFLSEEPFEGIFPNNPPFSELPRLSGLVGNNSSGLDFPRLGWSPLSAVPDYFHVWILVGSELGKSSSFDP